MRCVMHKTITSSTSTCTVVLPLMFVPSPRDDLQGTTMLLKLCNCGTMKPLGESACGGLIVWVLQCGGNAMCPAVSLLDTHGH